MSAVLIADAKFAGSSPLLLLLFWQCRQRGYLLLQDTLTKQESEEGRVEVLPVQWRKHLTLEVPCCSCAALIASAGGCASQGSLCLGALVNAQSGIAALLPS